MKTIAHEGETGSIYRVVKTGFYRALNVESDDGIGHLDLAQTRIRATTVLTSRPVFRCSRHGCGSHLGRGLSLVG